ncbi:MAG: rhodanese-like domain-containing protein [Akkermansiaceae bacterium]|nr:rhodanese-like domain-containing protein [Akkermansiaceae bacterium]
MTSSRANRWIFLAALGFTSCAETAREAPAVVKPVKEVAPSRDAHVAKPAPSPKKPVAAKKSGEVTSMSMEDFFPLQQSGGALIYDVRPSLYYQLGHIPGAIHFPKSNCDALIVSRKAEIETAIAAKKPIVLYCTDLACPDARTVAMHLASNGYSSSTLVGGWESWKNSGLPTD